MNMNEDEIIKEFLSFLAEKYQALTKIKLFLVGVPELFANGKITEQVFQTFLEKYELETAKFISEKNHYQQEIAKKLNITKEQVNFNLLVDLGHKEFKDISRKVLSISNEISLLLYKIAIYMKNFSKLQQEFIRLNNFLFQKDYSAKGVEMSCDPGRNFYGEA
jgi:hypothetical protein